MGGWVVADGGVCRQAGRQGGNGKKKKKKK